MENKGVMLTSRQEMDDRGKPSTREDHKIAVASFVPVAGFGTTGSVGIGRETDRGEFGSRG